MNSEKDNGGITVPHLLLVAAVVFPLAAGAKSTQVFKPSPVPGGVAVIAVKGSGQAPRVTYHAEPVLVRRTGTGWQAVVGIPLSAKAGRDALDVDGQPVPFTIKPKRYPVQRLHLENLSRRGWRKRRHRASLEDRCFGFRREPTLLIIRQILGQPPRELQ